MTYASSSLMSSSSSYSSSSMSSFNSSSSSSSLTMSSETSASSSIASSSSLARLSSAATASTITPAPSTPIASEDSLFALISSNSISELDFTAYSFWSPGSFSDVNETKFDTDKRTPLQVFQGKINRDEKNYAVTVLKNGNIAYCYLDNETFAVQILDCEFKECSTVFGVKFKVHGKICGIRESKNGTLMIHIRIDDDYIITFDLPKKKLDFTKSNDSFRKSNYEKSKYRIFMPQNSDYIYGVGVCSNQVTQKDGHQYLTVHTFDPESGKELKCNLFDFSSNPLPSVSSINKVVQLADEKIAIIYNDVPYLIIDLHNKGKSERWQFPSVGGGYIREVRQLKGGELLIIYNYGFEIREPDNGKLIFAQRYKNIFSIHSCCHDYGNITVTQLNNDALLVCESHGSYLYPPATNGFLNAILYKTKRNILRFLPALQTNTSVTRLNLLNETIDEVKALPLLEKIIQNNRNLTFVNICKTGISLLNVRDLHDLAAARKPPLELQSDKALLEAEEKKLHEEQERQKKLAEEEAKEEAKEKANKAHLRELYIKIPTLIEQVTKNAISEIDLSNCSIPIDYSDCQECTNIQCRPIKVTDILVLLRALKRNTSVKTLNLSNNNMIDDTVVDPLIKIYAPGMFSKRKPNAALVAIDVRGTSLTEKGAAKLAKAIQSKNPHVILLRDYEPYEQKTTKEKRLALQKAWESQRAQEYEDKYKLQIERLEQEFKKKQEELNTKQAKLVQGSLIVTFQAI